MRTPSRREACKIKHEVERILNQLSDDPTIRGMLRQWESYSLVELEPMVELFARPGRNGPDAEEAKQARAWLVERHGVAGGEIWDRAVLQPPEVERTPEQRARGRLLLRGLINGEMDGEQYLSQLLRLTPSPEISA